MNNIVLQKTWVQGRPVVVDNLLGTAFTGEAGAHTFKIRGVDAAQETVTISGTITGKLLAANNVTISLSGSIEDGCAVVTLTDECYDVPGRFIFSVYATSGSTTLCLYCAVGNVLRTDSQVIAYPTESLPNITSLMADLEQILADWPADYSQLQSDVSSLKSALTQDHIINYVDFSGSTADHFISDNGTYTEAQNYSVSQPFHVLKGQKVFFTARGYSNWISMISKYSNSVYTPLVISTGSTVTTYSYTATEDMDVVLSYRTEDLHECVFGYDLNDVYQEIANNIDSTLLKENMSAESSVVGNYILAPANIDFTGSTTGKFIYKNGTVYDNANFSYTNSFTAKPGDKITVKITGYEDNVSVISEKIGSEFVPCIISESSTEQEYTYEVEHIGQYVICYRTANTHTGYITSDILSTFRDWKKLPYIEMFTNMAGLGDSLMSGAVFKGSSWYDCKNYSWLSMLARSIGAKWYCYSQGGYTTKDWLSGGYKTMFENAEELPDCVFIAFGTNDRNNQSTIPTGTSSDTSTSETFCGYYKKIIELVHTKTPGAIIFCCSLYDNSDASSVQYSSLVYEIVKQYAYCHFIDIANNSKISRKVTNDYAEGDHFTTVGYLYIAELIKTLVNDAIQNDPADYKYLGYDNTSN